MDELDPDMSIQNLEPLKSSEKQIMGEHLLLISEAHINAMMQGGGIIANPHENNESCTLLHQLRTLLKGDPKFRKESFSDKYLTRSLLACQLNVKAAFDQISCFRNLRRLQPDLFTGWTTENFSGLVETNFAAVIPGNDFEGAGLAFFRLGLWNPEKSSFLEVLRAIILGTLVAAEEERIQENGLQIILDCQGFGFSHLRAIGIRNIQLVVHLMEECFPVRIKSLHFVNENIWIHHFVKMLCLFSSVIKRKLVCYGRDYDKLYETIPAQFLPDDLGGAAGLFNCEAYFQKMDSLKDVVEI